MVAAFLTGILLLYAFASFSRLADGYFRGVILASAAIAAVAYGDDTRIWPFWVKLGGQILAALLAVGNGLYVDHVNLPVLGATDLGLLGAAGTVAWILFATNAMNFIDGLNGLAAGVAAPHRRILAVIAALYGGWFVYFASLLLLAGLLGFLPFNFPHARIFMGDVGSQFCGFVLAVLTVAAGRFERVDLSVLLVPMLLFGVLYDVAFTLLRRLGAGERPPKPIAATSIRSPTAAACPCRPSPSSNGASSSGRRVLRPVPLGAGLAQSRGAAPRPAAPARLDRLRRPPGAPPPGRRW